MAESAIGYVNALAPPVAVTELFVNAQSFVFKLLSSVLLARFHQFDRREAEGVGDMPIATLENMDDRRWLCDDTAGRQS